MFKICMLCILFGYAAFAEGYVLKNGLTVHLKPLENDNGLLALQLVSNKGYRSFTEPGAAASFMALDASLEESIGSSSAEDVQYNQLLDYSNEFNYAVEPSYTYFEAEIAIEDSADFLKQLSNLILYPKWGQASLEKVAVKLKERIAAELKEPSYRFELAALTQLGMPEGKASLPPVDSLQQVTLAQAEKAFSALLQNPNQLVLIISGNFEPDVLRKEIEESFGRFQPKDVSFEENTIQPLTLPLPNVKEVSYKPYKENMIRLSLPLPYLLSESNFNQTELLKEALEISLREEADALFSENSSIDASLELPFYPSGQNAWIVIQLLSNSNHVGKDAEKLLALVRKRLKNGVEEAFVDKAKEQLKAADDFWKLQEEFWISFYANSYLMKFNPEEMILSRRMMHQISSKEITERLQTFPENHYTLLIAR